MSTYVALKHLAVPAPQAPSGFSLAPSRQSPRLLPFNRGPSQAAGTPFPGP